MKVFWNPQKILLLGVILGFPKNKKLQKASEIKLHPNHAFYQKFDLCSCFIKINKTFVFGAKKLKFFQASCYYAKAATVHNCALLPFVITLCAFSYKKIQTIERILLF